MSLYFEKITEKIAHELLPIWQDIEVTQYTYVKNIQNVEDARTKISRYLSYQHGLLGPFVVKDNNKVIGLAAGMSPEDQPSVSEIFFHFEKASWRKGYGTQAVNFLLNEGFNNHSLTEIQAQAVTENEASWRLLEKNGFLHKQLRKNAFQNEKDVYFYSITYEEYRNRADL